MNEKQLQTILMALSNIRFCDWEKLKVCVDREFRSQINTTTFVASDLAKKNLQLELLADDLN